MTFRSNEQGENGDLGEALAQVAPLWALARADNGPLLVWRVGNEDGQIRMANLAPFAQ